MKRSVDMLQKSRHALLLFLAALAALSTVGCIGWVEGTVAVPESVGTEAVGVTTFSVTDAARDRRLAVEAWYPATKTTLGREVYEVKAAGMAVARLRSALGAVRDATPDRADGPRPVFMLSHGAGSTRFGNVTFAEVLASHGYIVAAPDHAGHTTADKVGGIDDDDRARSAMDRPIDLSRVLDELARRNDSGDTIFGGQVDMSRVAVAGHSFGGRTALAMVGARFDGRRQAAECRDGRVDRRCRALPVFGEAPYRYRDARVKAAFLIAPAGFAFYRADGVRHVDAPVLVVGAERDETTPYVEQHQKIYASLDGERHMLTLPNAGHLTATDICRVVNSIGGLAKAFGGARAQDGCRDGDLPADVALDVVAETAVAFFAHYLGGRGMRTEDRLAALLDPAAVAQRVATVPAPSSSSPFDVAGR
ncbi:MAG: hypothetical protein RIF41_32665 [Polyangiaceae bacterium]